MVEVPRVGTWATMPWRRAWKSPRAPGPDPASRRRQTGLGWSGAPRRPAVLDAAEQGHAGVDRVDLAPVGRGSQDQVGPLQARAPDQVGEVHVEADRRRHAPERGLEPRGSSAALSCARIDSRPAAPGSLTGAGALLQLNHRPGVLAALGAHANEVHAGLALDA